MIKRFVRLDHPIVTHFTKLRGNKHYRQDHKELVVEGKKPILELCEQGKVNILLSCEERLDGLCAQEVYQVPRAVIDKLSTMEQSDGWMATVPFPQSKLLENMTRILALDGLADPGNVGNLVRTALALGWDAVVFLPNSVDPFNDKVVRAARGALFYLPIVSCEIGELLTISQQQELPIYLADTVGVKLEEIESPTRLILVLGNEARGASSEIRKEAISVSIPINPLSESLNVAAAGAILLHQFRGLYG